MTMRRGNYELSVTPATYELPGMPHDLVANRIIHGIALYPQQWMGAFIVADEAMAGFQLGLSPSRLVDILRLGVVQPDEVSCAVQINAIHESFHIGARITPGQAKEYVLRGAALALEALRTCAEHYAGNTFPTDLRHAKFYHDFQPEEYADFSGTQAFATYLGEDSDVQFEVATNIMEIADEVRANSHAAQAAAAAKGH